MKLGKKPATHDPRDLKLMQYVVRHALPTRPEEFGHERNIGVWSMFANDQVGDCVFAGAAHEHMVWTTEGFNPTPFSEESVLSDYSAVTGYVPGDPSTDQGTLVRDAMKYRRSTGLLDAAGARHTIAAYLAVAPANAEQMLNAMWLFGAIGVGIEFPDTAMDQFDRGQPWTVTPGAKVEGGHYVPLVAYRGGMFVCVTWGKLQLIAPSFLARYCDEAWAMLSTEVLRDGKSPEGFDLATLQSDLTRL